jgi:hypothetical protein
MTFQTNAGNSTLESVNNNNPCSVLLFFALLALDLGVYLCNESTASLVKETRH